MDSPNALVKYIIQIIIIPSLNRIGRRRYKKWIQHFTSYPYFKTCLEEPSIHFTLYLYIKCMKCVYHMYALCTLHYTLAVQLEHKVSFSFIFSSPLSDHRQHKNNHKCSDHYNMHILCRHRENKMSRHKTIRNSIAFEFL